MNTATFLKKTMALTLAFSFLAYAVAAAVEPMVANAVTDDVVVSLTVNTEISITSPADTTLLPAMGITSNSAIASSTWNVKTNDAAGYILYIKNASTTQALKGIPSSIGNFADYTETVANTPDTWAVDASTYQFGYSVRGTDVNTGTYGTDTTCGAAGTPSANLKFRSASTTNIQAATRTSTTTTAGIDTIACWAAGQNGVYAPGGSYSATLTATASAL